MALHKAGHSM